MRSRPTTPLVIRQMNTVQQWFPTEEEFLPREEFHEFRGGISTFYLSYLFVVQ